MNLLENKSPTTFARNSRLTVKTLSEVKMLIPQFNDGITPEYCPEPAEIYSKAIACFRQSVNDCSDNIINLLYPTVSSHLYNIVDLHQNENSLIVDFYSLLKAVIFKLDLDDNYKVKTSIPLQKHLTISFLSEVETKYDVDVNKEKNNHVDIRVCSKDAQVPEILIGVKKTSQSTVSEPLTQACAYYHKYSSNYLRQRKSGDRTNPSLLLVLEGSHLCVYGCVTQLIKDYEGNYKDISFTCSRSLYSFDFAAEHYSHQQHVRICCALLATICKTATLLTEERNSEANQDILSGFLPTTMLSHPSIEPKATFRIMSKLVYVNGSKVWKYTQNYGVSAHKEAVNLEIAPNFQLEHIGGDWDMIIMDKIDGVTLLDKSVTHNRENWEKFVESVSKFNEEFYHGDIREPNIIFSNERYYLIDFDWGRSKNEISFYPPDLNSDVFSCEGIHPGSQILVEHDKFQLEKLTKKLFTD